MASPPGSIHRAIAALQRLADVFSERRSQIARAEGLSVGQWRVLEEVATEHFMPSLFAEQRSVTAAAVSKLLRGLLERGLIRVSIAKQDRRERVYVLTRSGKRLLDRVRLARQTAIDEVWADLPAAQLKRFAEFGEQLADRLERYLDR